MLTITRSFESLVAFMTCRWLRTIVSCNSSSKPFDSVWHVSLHQLLVLLIEWMHSWQLYYYVQEMSQIYNEKKSSYDSLSAGFETNRSKLEQVSLIGWQPASWIQTHTEAERDTDIDTCRDRDWHITHRLSEAWTQTYWHWEKSQFSSCLSLQNTFVIASQA